MEGKRFVAAADYEVSYPHPVEFSVGDRVRIGREDSTWPGWVWTRTGDGNEGWAPLPRLDPAGDGTAVAREAYTARELSMRRGDRLVSLRVHSGWLWCRNQHGEEGWVPAFNLKPVEPS